MLALTLERRTYEMGVRSTLGAGPVLLAGEFFLESVIICTFSALVGEVLALVLLPHVCEKLLRTSVVHPSFTVALTTIVLAFVTGIVGGLLPAIRAATMSPWEALRRGA